MYKKLILAALLATASSQVIAQEATDSTTTQEYGAISPRISTLGLGLEYKYPVTDTFSASAGIYGASYSREESDDDYKLDVEVRLLNLALLGNYYPWENGFHVDGGIILNGSKLDLHIEPGSDETYTFGDDEYNASDIGSADAKVNFRKVAPYLGIGYDNGNKAGAGWSIAASAGVMFSGSPNVDFNVTCGEELKNNFPDKCLDLKSDAQVEEDELRDDFDSFKAYPVLSIGVMYKF